MSQVLSGNQMSRSPLERYIEINHPTPIKTNVFILYGQCIILGSTILISTVNNSLYFLRKLIIIHRFLETDSTEIYTPRLSLGQNCQQPPINHRLHEIIMMVSYLNFHRRRFGCFFKLM